MKEALKLALEALQWSKPHKDAVITHGEAITAIIAALAQEEQEHIGEAHLMQEGFTHCIWAEAAVPVWTKLYTTPPQRTWVGLTDEEIEQSYETTGHYQKLRLQDKFAVYALAKAIEAKLKEKNT